jgi:intron-binding protein aquarius
VPHLFLALTDLPHTQANKYFKLANPGFRWEYQLIDVGDFQGIGEMAPSRYFLQNLGEAEYLVAVYMYMRLLGYPAERITFLTTYQGQKALLNDVVRNRCGSHPFFGMPAQVSREGEGGMAGLVWKNDRPRTVEFSSLFLALALLIVIFPHFLTAQIETVDKYQGSQNDYILLSLVRTKSVGFMRDVRRLIVAMSRARLGLYVFCRYVSLLIFGFSLGNDYTYQ